MNIKAFLLLAAVAASAAASGASALEGAATYAPAESNLAVKYWVSGSAASGRAPAALDGKPETIWAPARGQSDLLVDLGGAYDAVHKVRVNFANPDTAKRYRLHGSADGETWRVLADRSSSAVRGGVFTDVFSHPGLRHLRLELIGDPAGGVRDIEVINYLRPDLVNGSDSSEQGGNTNAYYYNAGNAPPGRRHPGRALHRPGIDRSGK